MEKNNQAKTVFVLEGGAMRGMYTEGVVDTLLAIGMDEEVIEEGLEKYADIWRDRFISSAFFNKPFSSKSLCANGGISYKSPKSL